MNPTQTIKNKLGLKTVPEVQDSKWRMFDDGGVEVEVGEFLYGLVRAIKPKRVLETGLYSAISAMYIALGLKKNGFGHLDTVEYEQAHLKRSKERIIKIGVQDVVTEYLEDSRTFNTPHQYELMFLILPPISST